MAIVGPEKSWRLVHDGNTILFFEETAGYTETKYTIFESSIKAACEAKIKELGLNPLDPTTSGVAILSSLQFMERFSLQTQLAVVAATKQNDVVKLWYDKMLAADQIDLTDQRTIEGVNAMVSLGIISEYEAKVALA
jgi:hypothetical protein